MSTRLNVAAVAAAMTVFLTPALASAMTTAHGKVLPARGARTPVVIAPDGRVLGTDPSAAVRFELARDSSRGR
jgi:hypothetical protein